VGWVARRLASKLALVGASGLSSHGLSVDRKSWRQSAAQRDVGTRRGATTEGKHVAGEAHDGWAEVRCFIRTSMSMVEMLLGCGALVATATQQTGTAVACRTGMRSSQQVSSGGPEAA
jgi:hypothetical protein